MSLVLNGSGTITGLSAGGLPDATITQAELASNVAGNGPAFRAFIGSNQSLAAGDTIYVAQLTSETFDVGGCFNNTGSTVTLNGLSVPAYSFCPNVAGYYQINAKAYINRASANVYALVGILKNGSGIASGSYLFSVPVIDAYSSTSDLVYLNGSTDYIQMYVQASNPCTAVAGAAVSVFSASLVRAA